ncbi:pilus assembly protein [Vibrio sp. JC009]|uniref:TadE/TadG family type IV pilus assembly protein n=1 Tax=Vibrio sp. JC009 TaxID=2912314 RepID=UPI0023AFAB4B|nr:TadE/TadG family type IV pilus assembly protein [Vibrio sp. JC009]WED21225.1 pilus assembly protein [Vibrio sp. JC009]
MRRYMGNIYKKAQKGIAIVEFTIVSAAFIFLLFAVAEGGRYIYSYNSVAHAARDGARYASVRGSNAALDSLRASDAPATQSSVASYLSQKSPLGNLSVSVNWETINKDPGEEVSVTVSYNFTSFMLLFNSITLTSTATSTIYF